MLNERVAAVNFTRGERDAAYTKLVQAKADVIKLVKEMMDEVGN